MSLTGGQRRVGPYQIEERIPELGASVGRLQVWMLAGLILLALLSAGSLIVNLL
jgi:hypothetical protein